MSTLIAQYFGMASADIGAIATAEVSPANAMTCVKPFTIPDKWNEAQTPPWDGDDTYDAFDNKGRAAGQPRHLHSGEPARIHRLQPGGQPRRAARDSRRTGNNITVSFYFSLAMGTGHHRRRRYAENIANCNTTIYHWGDP